MSKRNPFDFVKNVSYDKKDIMVDEVEEKSYAPFLVNRALSYHKDAIYFVNEMNTNHGLDNRLQYVPFFLSNVSFFPSSILSACEYIGTAIMINMINLIKLFMATLYR